MWHDSVSLEVQHPESRISLGNRFRMLICQQNLQIIGAPEVAISPGILPEVVSSFEPTPCLLIAYLVFRITARGAASLIRISLRKSSPVRNRTVCHQNLQTIGPQDHPDFREYSCKVVSFEPNLT
jgi:hypothetical protein